MEYVIYLRIVDLIKMFLVSKKLVVVGAFFSGQENFQINLGVDEIVFNDLISKSEGKLKYYCQMIWQEIAQLIFEQKLRLIYCQEQARYQLKKRVAFLQALFRRGDNQLL